MRLQHSCPKQLSIQHTSLENGLIARTDQFVLIVEYLDIQLINVTEFMDFYLVSSLPKKHPSAHSVTHVQGADFVTASSLQLPVTLEQCQQLMAFIQHQ